MMIGTSMVLVVVTKCRYPQFEELRDRLITDERIKTEVIVDGYSKKLCVARFWFSQKSEVPDDLKQFIVANRSEKSKEKRSKPKKPKKPKKLDKDSS